MESSGSRIKDKAFNQLGIALIVISSGLLGIWAVRDTIALRNILLVSGSILALIYLYVDIQNQRNTSLFKLTLKHFLEFLPIILIGLMFIWVIVHYAFFSQFPEKQWDELSSTWLRAFLASIIGFACALALSRNRDLAWLLWLGLIISFLVLFCQYIPKAIAKHSLHAYDPFGNYIYWAKFNGVLAGMILFAGILGLSIDSMRYSLTRSSLENNGAGRFQTVVIIFVTTLGIILPIYAFVFIFNAKNGIGVSAILLIFWFVIGGFYLLRNSLRRDHYQHSNHRWFRYVIGYLVIICSFSWLAYQQTKINPGWESLIEDIKIARQIDKYQHWKSSQMNGYPKRADGSNVAPNTYERVAWALVGLRLIADNPVGNGLLRSLPSQMKQGGVDFNDAAYTHSAWIDFGLSYGLLGLLLLPSALIFCMIVCIKKYNGFYRASVISLAVVMLVLYLLGEYAFQHGIEILLFICSLIVGLIWFEPAEYRLD